MRRKLPLSPVHSALTLALALLLLTVPAAAAVIDVAVSVLPQKHFVEQLANGRAHVIVLVGPGQSPATFDPGPRRIAEVANADLLLPLGLPFERAWLPRIAAVNPSLHIVDCSEGIERLHLPAHRHGDHAHAGESDPHIWTDPSLVARMLPALTKALAVVDPAGSEIYRRNAEAYAEELHELDADLRAALAGLEERRFLVFHPSWGYFARAYGLEQIAIESEGKEPGARALTQLITWARDAGVSAVFVQQQFAAGTARAVADAIGARLVQVDPLAEDYEDNLRRVAEILGEALR